MTQRVAFLETLRGVACVLLVSWHVVGDGSAHEGLGLLAGHVLPAANALFIPLRMPVFAFISGYVFQALARDLNGAAGTAAIKVRRLLLPLIFVGTLHFLLQALLKGHDLGGIWQVYFATYEHFWYLQVSFSIMMLLLAANLAWRGRQIAAAAMCLAISLPLYVTHFSLAPDWFSIAKLPYLAPFFFTGQLFRLANVDAFLRQRLNWRIGVLVTTGAAIVFLYYAYLHHVALFGIPFSLRSPEMLALSLCICGFLFALRWENRAFIWIGSYAFAIYLFHVMFTAGFRTFDAHVTHEHNVYLLWASSVAVGVMGPMAVAKLLERGPPIFATCFLGVRYARRPRRIPAAAPMPAHPPLVRE